jgi:16S rRNA (uracil1498-N3)-methyltransferase
LRLKAGGRWAALDGLGRSWLCEVVDKQTSRRIDDWPAVPPLPVSVVVALALCKGSRFEDAIEKLAELGAQRLIPLQTERTERGLPSPAKSQRWNQIAQSGSALANRLVPMSVAPARDLEDLLTQLDPATAVYCHHDGARPEEIFHPPRNDYTLLIGPEGGFSPPELEALQGRARRVSLGPLTLRVETAAVCALVLALQSSGT